MLTPEEVERLSDAVVSAFVEFEATARGVAAEALSDFEGIDPETVRRAIMNAGSAEREAIERSIIESMTQAARTGLLDDEQVYALARNAGIIAEYLPLAESIVIQRILEEAIGANVVSMNLTRTAALNAISTEFTLALGQATIAVASGAQTYDQAIAGAVKRIADGVGTTTVTYISESGRVIEQPLYTAVRRAVMTTTKDMTLRMQEARPREVGASWVQISAHMGARPEPAVWQGAIVLFDELETFTDGGLHDPNCRHTWGPFFPGIMEPTDWGVPTGDLTDAQKAENLHQYALSQRQRQCERNIRTYTARSRIYEAAGDMKKAEHNAQLARNWRSEAYTVSRERRGFTRPDREVAFPGEARI